MKVSRLPLTRLILSTLAGIGLFSSLLAQRSWAQLRSDDNVNTQPLQDYLSPQQQNNNPFSSQSRGDNLGMMDLVRRATQGGKRSAEDYSNEQNQNLDSAASQFRARQLQQIQGAKPNSR